MKSTTIGMAMLVLAACSTQRTVKAPEGVIAMCIDSAFDHSDRAAVDSALRQWGAMLAPAYRIQTHTIDANNIPLGRCDRTIIRADTRMPWIGFTSDATLGFTHADRRNAWLVVDRIPRGLLTYVACHEIGHMFGLDHTDPTDGGLMSPGSGLVDVGRPCFNPNTSDEQIRITEGARK
jgi:hypothetical protein